MKSEFFRKALDGEFKEACQQAVDLPEEDPDIFSFVVAYLYEERFVPLKSLGSVLSECKGFFLGYVVLRGWGGEMG